MSRRRVADRASTFAQGALQKGLVTRAQAEECVAVARKMARRGKTIAIEEVFVRKGYLSKTNAHGIDYRYTSIITTRRATGGRMEKRLYA